MSKAFLCLILLLGLYNCEEFEGAKVFEIQRNSNGLNEFTVDVKEGEEFALKLRGNPTTGYSWFLLNPNDVTDSLQASNLSSEGKATYIPDSNDPNLVGGAGAYYYKFKAVKVANEPKVLHFLYQRAWLKNENSVPTVSVKVNVS